MPDTRYHKGEIGERPWGRWEVLETGSTFCVKRIDVLPGARLSLQLHHHRREDWIIVEGVGVVEVDGKSLILTAGGKVHIPQGATHRISNHSLPKLTFIEVQHGEILDENDIVRIEDDYGR